MDKQGYNWFLVPSFSLVVLFTMIPIIFVIVLSFTNFSIRNMNLNFIGIRNFERFFSNPTSRTILLNTLKYTFVVTFFQFVIGFGFAFMLKFIQISDILKGLLGAILFLPFVFSDVSAVGTWKWLFNDSYGLINYILGLLGFKSINWFTDPNLAFLTVMSLNIWKGYPFTMILELAGLQTIPKSLLEASAIDGAKGIQTLLYVIIPSLKYIIITNFVLICIYTFNMFNLVYALTNGGPVHTTEIIGVTMYKAAFESSRLGYASSIALIMVLINALGVFIYLLILRKKAGEV